MLKTSLLTKKILCFSIISILIFSACGCKSAKNEKNLSNTVNFTDALNRKVSIPKKPQRVAALIGSFADVWVLSGGRLCAAAEDAWDDFGFESENAVNLGGAHSPNLENLLSANPQFVIASASTASNVEMLKALESADIPVAYFDVDCFGDYLEMLDICTDITGRKDLYRQNGLQVKTKIEEIKTNFKNAEIPEENKKILLLRISSGSVKVKDSNGTVLGEMLKDLGCINIADSEASLLENLSAESVIKQNPYRIFAVTMGDDITKAEKNLKTILSDSAWNTLDAVNSGRIHIMDKKLFNLKPNSKWAESYEKLSKILLEKSEQN